MSSLPSCYDFVVSLTRAHRKRMKKEKLIYKRIRKKIYEIYIQKRNSKNLVSTRANRQSFSVFFIKTSQWSILLDELSLTRLDWWAWSEWIFFCGIFFRVFVCSWTCGWKVQVDLGRRRVFCLSLSSRIARWRTAKSFAPMFWKITQLHSSWDFSGKRREFPRNLQQ